MQVKKEPFQKVKMLIMGAFGLESMDFELTPSSLSKAIQPSEQPNWKNFENWEAFEKGEADVSAIDLFSKLFYSMPVVKPLFIITDDCFAEKNAYFVSEKNLLHFTENIYPELHQSDFVQPLDFIFFSSDDSVLTMLHHEGKHIQIQAVAKQKVKR